MTEIPEWLNLQVIQAELVNWFNTQVLNFDNALQAGLIALVYLVAVFIGPRMRRAITASTAAKAKGVVWQEIVHQFASHLTPLIALLLLLIVATVVSGVEEIETNIVMSAASLSGAWVVIDVASSVIRNRMISRFITWSAWTVAAIVALGWFRTVAGVLDSVALSFGAVRISLLSVLQGAVVLAVLLWAAVAVSNAIERYLKRLDTLTPSMQVLGTMVIKISLITIACLIGISSLGIDFTALTVFGGALGIGIGFGLQKVISNLVSGLLLLLDKSIKPNDVIAVGGTYGWVDSLGARYASVRTRDGIEYLIPNEDLITQRVENWSHTDRIVRLRIPVGVSYDTDLNLATDLCKKAARAVERVLESPEPRCLLRGFGDNSVDLEIRIWIGDPANGRANVISAVLHHVWNSFKEHEIEIPFPQRDLHLRSGFPVNPDQQQ
ncbi:MAG: mechanosensitive ion channel [Rhodobacteraceae bacterium]|nr:mechanosensitive ion channel [Paracoccaceae bacterium]